MTAKEYNEILEQLGVLEQLQERYGGKTLDNIIDGLRARLREYNITNESKA